MTAVNASPILASNKHPVNAGAGTEGPPFRLLRHSRFDRWRPRFASTSCQRALHTPGSKVLHWEDVDVTEDDWLTAVNALARERAGQPRDVVYNALFELTMSTDAAATTGELARWAEIISAGLDFTLE
ncbi:hypothetical protein [Orlajensenia leifsoniae]|uniref:Uncharacterized protein n=1 Tax=Orlajensenia leifsoniae TaxID=2561933 RepID=A0A4Y9R5N5_9MICO|nr:hypothetical protein [Leifsonia flava]TFV99889.1 hypothetical protein E4M00_01405 [Leifsonia flava]